MAKNKTKPKNTKVASSGAVRSKKKAKQRA